MNSQSLFCSPKPGVKYSYFRFLVNKISTNLIRQTKSEPGIYMYIIKYYHEINVYLYINITITIITAEESLL